MVRDTKESHLKEKAHLRNEVTLFGIVRDSKLLLQPAKAA